jgi:hypothetical protein
MIFENLTILKINAYLSKHYVFLKNNIYQCQKKLKIVAHFAMAILSGKFHFDMPLKESSSML